MNIYSKKLIKPLITNLLILFFFVVLIELIFGYWFDKDNFGPYLREHRMKNQISSYIKNGKTYDFIYRRNYYGFRGDDIEPSEIDAIIMGGSVVDERYKPEQFTITGYLNKNLEINGYKTKIINAGIEAQATTGMIYNFDHWFTKLKKFSPKIIIFYIGINDLRIPEVLTAKTHGQGHVKNHEKFEAFFDNIKSRSFLYDSIRIFKFKYLPKKNFVKYDGNIDPDLKKKFNFITYESAINTYDIKILKNKYDKKINIYLSRVDILFEKAKKINSNTVFITNIGSAGHEEQIFIFNYSLIEHCKKKKYDCIDLAKKVRGKYTYWRGYAHTTKEGSELIANLITEDLLKFFKK